jgi:hypothetical protein
MAEEAIATLSFTEDPVLRDFEKIGFPGKRCQTSVCSGN